MDTKTKQQQNERIKEFCPIKLNKIENKFRKIKQVVLPSHSFVRSFVRFQHDFNYFWKYHRYHHHSPSSNDIINSEEYSHNENKHRRRQCGLLAYEDHFDNGLAPSKWTEKVHFNRAHYQNGLRSPKDYNYMIVQCACVVVYKRFSFCFAFKSGRRSGNGACMAEKLKATHARIYATHATSAWMTLFYGLWFFFVFLSLVNTTDAHTYTEQQSHTSKHIHWNKTNTKENGFGG